MRLWIVSDLHVELTRGWDLPSGENRPEFDVLVVAGDLVSRMERGVKWLLDRVPDKPVIYVAGNHEAYGGDVPTLTGLFKGRTRQRDGSNTNGTSKIQNRRFRSRLSKSTCPRRAILTAGDRYKRTLSIASHLLTIAYVA